MIAVALVAAVVGMSSAPAPAPPQTGATPAAAPACPCHEDMPCWNWRTMGNRRRGLTTVSGRFVVVTGPMFDVLKRGHRISWQRSARMTGDRR